MSVGISSQVETRQYQQDTVDFLAQRAWDGDTEPLCVFAPTGGGKTLVFRQLTARLQPRPVTIYVDRKELLKQTAQHLEAEGVDFGIRAAGHDPALLKDVQLCMIQTVRSRRATWDLHRSDVVIADEAHCMATGDNLAILKQHQADGAMVVGFTATPVFDPITQDGKRVKPLFTELYQSVKYEYLFKHGYLTPAVYYDVDQPDRAFIKSVKVPCEVVLREDSKSEVKTKKGKKMVYKHTQQVVGRVIQHWRKLNPFQLPTLLFAPDCDSSFWMATQFEEAGVPAAHIDGKECYVDGELFPGVDHRDEIIERFKAGDIKVITNRFVMTTGVDIPEIFHLILAVPYGSMKIFRQACGRLFRKHPAYDIKLIQDHGANAWRHGNPMADVDWDLDKKGVDYLLQQRHKMKYHPEETEPIRCFRCGALRRVIIGGDNVTCPNCNFKGQPGKRRILQTNGTLVEVDTPFIPPPNYVPASDRAKKDWEQCVWRMIRSKGRKTLSQTVALFQKEHWGQEPHQDWKYMPKSSDPEERGWVFKMELREEMFGELRMK